MADSMPGAHKTDKWKTRTRLNESTARRQAIG